MAILVNALRFLFHVILLKDAETGEFFAFWAPSLT